MSANMIEARNLTKIYGGGRTIFGSLAYRLEAVSRVSLTLGQGQTLALVGESGSGKSTVARMLVGLMRPSSGEITVAGHDVAVLRRQGPRALGRVIQYVFQDPIASLNPRKTVRKTLHAPLKLLKGYDASTRHARIVELLEAVKMPFDTLDRYPHELSGGQAQRIAIARALAADAKILILDEPVSALDVSVQAQVLLLLQDLKAKYNLSYLFISHDLAIVEAVSDQVAVMRRGHIVENGPTNVIFSQPRSSYTRGLIESAPRLRSRVTGDFE